MIPSLHVKRSAELWLDIFCEHLVRIAEEKPFATAIEDAHLIADAAVDRFEKRWPGVKL